MKKSFILGFIVAAILFSFLPVGAAIQTITVKLSGVKYQVNGHLVEMAKTPPINYGNTNYAPIRPIVEAMGGAIAMDSNTNTVIITSSKDEQSVDLAIQTPISTSTPTPTPTPIPTSTPTPSPSSTPSQTPSSANDEISIEETRSVVIVNPISNDSYFIIKVKNISIVSDVKLEKVDGHESKYKPLYTNKYQLVNGTFILGRVNTFEISYKSNGIEKK